MKSVKIVYERFDLKKIVLTPLPVMICQITFQQFINDIIKLRCFSIKSYFLGLD